MQDVDGGGLWPRSSVLSSLPAMQGGWGTTEYVAGRAVRPAAHVAAATAACFGCIYDEDGRGDKPLPSAAAGGPLTTPIGSASPSQPKLTPQPPTVPMLGPMAGATTHRPLKSLRQRPIRSVLSVAYLGGFGPG